LRAALAGSQGEPRRSTRRLDTPLLAVAGIAAVGLLLRVVYVFAVAGDTPLVGDAFENEIIANSLASGRGYSVFTLAEGSVPTAHKPPLYPLLMGAASAVGLGGTRDHQLISVVLGTATIVVAAIVARRLIGPRAGVLAAVLAAVYPIFLITDASLRSETLFALLVGLALLAAFAAAKHPTIGRFALVGGLIGLATLTRAEGIWLLLLLAASLAWRAPRGRGRLMLAALAACVIVLVPWTVRCWVVFDRPVFISTNSGDLLAGANCSETYRGAGLGTWAPRCATGGGTGNGAETSARLASRGLNYARDHMERLPAVLPARVLRTFTLFRPEQQLDIDLTEGRSRTAGELGRFMCYILLPSAAAGLFVLRRRGKTLLIVAVPLALVIIISLTAYGTTRFRIAGDLALVVLAAVALDAVIERFRPRGRPEDAGTPSSLLQSGHLQQP
jgi:4-amino-4-deoxy-L-arabinose transferase-like glycosyltransferase